MAMPNEKLVSYTRVRAFGAPPNHARKVKGVIKLPDRALLVTASSAWQSAAADNKNRDNLPEEDNRVSVHRVTKE